MIVGLLVSTMSSCTETSGSESEVKIEIAADLDQRLAKFAPVKIGADLSDLSATDRQVLEELIAASKLMGEIFLRQAWHQNPAILDRLQKLEHPQREQALSYFRLLVGP